MSGMSRHSAITRPYQPPCEGAANTSTRRLRDTEQARSSPPAVPGQGHIQTHLLLTSIRIRVMSTANSTTDKSFPPDIARGLTAIAEPSRARVVAYLGGGERCVCDLGAALGLSPALASHHLRVLRSSGLLRERRAGRWVYYSLDLARLEQLRNWIDGLLTPSNLAAAASVRSDCGFEPAATR